MKFFVYRNKERKESFKDLSKKTTCYYSFFLFFFSIIFLSDNNLRSVFLDKIRFNFLIKMKIASPDMTDEEFLLSF